MTPLSPEMHTPGSGQSATLAMSESQLAPNSFKKGTKREAYPTLRM